jgi:hypothetical protein
VDLFAYGEDGSVLGTDEAPDKTPTLVICPPHPSRIFVVARVASGHGLVALGAQRVRPEDASKVGKASGARNVPGEAERQLLTWSGLDERIARHRRLIGGTWQDLRRVAVPVDPRIVTNVSASIDAERCLDVLVVPAQEVSHLDVALLDLEGRIVGRAAASGRERAIIVCSPVQAAVTVEIRPQAGRGVVAVVLSRSLAGSEADIDAQVLRFELAPAVELAVLQRQLRHRLEAVGYGAAKIVGRGSLEIGRRSSVNLELPAGCSRLDVLGGAPVRGVEAWLWHEDGSLLARERGGGQTTVFCCGPTRKARLDVEALARPGRFLVELRRETETAEALSKEPLAASRLLSRMVSRGIVQSARQVGAVRRAELSPLRVESFDVLVPIGRCIDVTLALGGGASGAEVRLIDRANGQEVMLARGTYSTSARACALDRPTSLQVRVELRADSGESAALVATRMLSPKP